MKISKAILEKMGACEEGLSRFVSKHGNNELNFSECVKSESNTVSDYFWFIRNQTLNDENKRDLQFFAIDCAERVLHIFESKYPDDKRPRTAIETAKHYLKGDTNYNMMRESHNAAADAANAATAADAADAADYAATAAYAATATYAADAADAADYAATAAYAATATYAAAAADAAAAAADAYERSWQIQRLSEIVSKWEAQ